MSGNQMPSKNRILIIDDDFINREILKNILCDQFVFAEAENGQMGLEMVEQYFQELCVILLDVEMPIMNGMELLKILHQRGILGQIPVFLITSNEELSIAQAAYDMGVMGVITKPVVPFIVIRRIQIIVELFQARDALNARVERQEKTLQENVETIDALHRNTLEALASAIEFRDVESGEHTNRIYDITKILLRDTEMGAAFTAEEIENMAIGSIMHDVGKISISDVILNKPGKLTKEEFETMKEHTVKGGALMEQLNKLQTHPSYAYAWDIALHHHERWDGRGYPHGLKGDEITVWSQVVSIADVYDALVSPRVYKKACSHEKAVQMICDGECGAFNPKLIACFLQVAPQIRKLYISLEDGGLEREGPNTILSGVDKEDLAPSKELTDILLLAAAVQSAYDMIIYANLTQNTFYMMDYDRFQTHCVGNDGVFDDLISAGAMSVPEPHRQLFIDTFCRENLLNTYAQGIRTVNLEHPQYSDDGRLLDVSTTVLLMEDPRTGDVREITLSRYLGEK